LTLKVLALPISKYPKPDPTGSLIHDYFGIDLEAVWDTLKKNVPAFKEKLTRVLIYEKQTG